MKCPECKTKLTTKHYDPTYEWYECPKCEGAYTHDEILEAELRDRVQPKVKSKRNGKVRDHRGRTGVVAKGKKRRTEIAEDAELADEMVEAITKKPRKAVDAVHHRDELDTGQVVNIWADEIQEIFHDLGSSIDEENARDKALTIWREIHIHAGVNAREQAVPYAVCSEHEDA